MRPTEPHPEPREEDDPTWQLLGRARVVPSDARFTRRVVREARLMAESEQADGSWSASLSAAAAWLFRPAPALSFAAAAFLAVAAWSLRPADTGPEGGLASGGSAAPPEVREFDPAREIGHLEYLGQLMAVMDPAALDDHALADLLF